MSGVWMIHRLDAWDRFTDPHYWGLDAMVLVWAIFTLVLFVAEPLFLHRWFHHRATRDPDGTFRVALLLHLALLTMSMATIICGVLGAHSANVSLSS